MTSFTVITSINPIRMKNPAVFAHSTNFLGSGRRMTASMSVNRMRPPSSAGNGKILMTARLMEMIAANMITYTNPIFCASPTNPASPTGPVTVPRLAWPCTASPKKLPNERGQKRNIIRRLFETYERYSKRKY